MLGRLVCSGALLGVAAACGGSYGVRTDGGQAGCTAVGEAFLPVTVLDASAAPVAGATVTARSAGTGKTVIATTNERGTTMAIGQSLGPGTVEVRAQKDSTRSNTGQATISCGECGCTFDPGSLTLHLAL
jgi:hypothetical protein